MLATSGAQGLFDPTREEIRFAFFRSPEELMPYNDFVRGLWLDMREGRLTLPGARSVIAATARSYLALFELQDGRIEQGIVELEAALAVFPDHFAAARLQAKALAAADRSKAEIESAVERAVALYGPSLSELLPIALAVARDADHALAWVRRWCHFIVRVRWARPEDHIVPQATWAAVEPYLDQLAPGLKTAVRQWSGSS